MPKHKHLVYITSVIHFGQKVLSYSAVRSSFSPQERLAQTIKTIESIRQYLPEAYIVLVESGTQEQGLEILKEKVDTFLYAGNAAFIRKVVDSPYKGAGEIISLLFALWNTRKKDVDYITKISGRYWIDDNFDEKSFFNKHFFSFLASKKSYSTRLYNLASSKKRYRILLLIMGFFISFANISIEIIFYYLIPSSRVSLQTTLGVSGYIGVNGDTIHE